MVFSEKQKQCFGCGGIIQEVSRHNMPNGVMLVCSECHHEYTAMEYNYHIQQEKDERRLLAMQEGVTQAELEAKVIVLDKRENIKRSNSAAAVESVIKSKTESSTPIINYYDEIDEID